MDELDVEDTEALQVVRGAGKGDDQRFYVPSMVCLDDKLERKVPEGFTPKHENTLIVVASEPRGDRARDVVMDSWRLGAYKRNPRILWGHNHSIPSIGRAIQSALVGEVEGKRRLVQEIAFDNGDPLAEAVGRKYREGFLNAVSVGFISHRREWRTDLGKDDPHRSTAESRWRGGMKLSDNELLETSAVNVPMLASALGVKRGAELDDDQAASLDRLKWALQNDSELQDLIRALIKAEAKALAPAGPTMLTDLFPSS